MRRLRELEERLKREEEERLRRLRESKDEGLQTEMRKSPPKKIR